MPFPSGFVVMNGWKGSEAIDGESVAVVGDVDLAAVCRHGGDDGYGGSLFCATASSEFFRILVSACEKRASSM